MLLIILTITKCTVIRVLSRYLKVIEVTNYQNNNIIRSLYGFIRNNIIDLK